MNRFSSPRSFRSTAFFASVASVVSVVSFAFCTAPAYASPKKECKPTKPGIHVAAQPEAWRLAVENLVASTRAPDLPWGCVGGEVDLEVHGETATLTVVDEKGQAISREVTSPDDVGPLGEALLAKPMLEPDPEPAPAPKPAEVMEKKAETKPVLASREAPRLRDPRLLAGLTIGPRYAGPNHLLYWTSITASASVPFRPFGGSIWVRFDRFSRGLDGPVVPTREVALGLGGYWSKSFGRFEFRPALQVSLAIVTRTLPANENFGGPRPQQQNEAQFREETLIDFVRPGGRAQFFFRLNQRFRLVAGLDAEMSVWRIGTLLEDRRLAGPASHLPAYSMALTGGLEVVALP